MATSSSMCAVCDLRHQSSASTHWCTECEESLCSDCKEHHNVLKATRNHKTIPISDYQPLPTVVTENQQFCVYHNEKYQLYCVIDREPICYKCTKEHGKCGEVIPLEEVVDGFKTSEDFIDLELSLIDMLNNVKKLREAKLSNITSIKHQTKEIKEQHCKLQTQVIQHLKQINEKFEEELENRELLCCDSIRSYISSLQDKEREINLINTEIQTMKKYASDLQTFLSMRDLQAKVTDRENDLQSMIENTSNDILNIESVTDVAVNDFLNVSTFCSLSVKKNPSANFDMYRRKDRQAQILVQKDVKSTTNIKCELNRKLHTACKFPLGCCVTTKGEFVFTNYDKEEEDTLTVLTTNGEVSFQINFSKSYRSFDVVCVDDTTVAVSSGFSDEKPGICFLNLISRKLIKFIALPDSPYGITYDGKSLICGVINKDIHVISCADYSITTIPNTALCGLSYISCFDDKIFLTNPDQHIVTCYLYTGEKVWEFRDETILRDPWGITTDNKGNIVVAGYSSRNVVVISNDGKQCEQLLSFLDVNNILNTPEAIFFDNARKQLLVTKADQEAIIYNISYI
ncbi:E3 ubiquitin-protein ligase TRIM71-like [Mytilus trossulus]|uniref:E3 ubiquitin-protein ligase TRIM71-like n=1 Tax=Mytilus trossulus TaxID=6551 RepID=UPI003005B5BA